jgi:hypothetical protein
MDSTERVDRLRRSIQAFERLHAVIVGFALTTGVRTFAEPWLSTHGTFPHVPSGLFLFIAFLSTLIPFFHGATRHLELVHLSPGMTTRRGLLMFDYIMLFLEGGIFVLLGMAILSPDHFLEILYGLLIVDSFWAMVTWAFFRDSTYLLKFLALNVFALVGLELVHLKLIPSAWPLVLAAGATVRTIVDYAMNWNFFFDVPEETAPDSSRPKQMRKRIAIESPYAGNIEQNVAFAKNVCRYVTHDGKSPYAMHLMFPQFLNESKQEERELGIECGLSWVDAAEEVWFCLSDHPSISGGMRIALDHLLELKAPPTLRYFRFNQEGKPLTEFTSSDFVTPLA